jgi:hypothetical protein
MEGIKFSWSFYCLGTKKLKYLKIYLDDVHIFFIIHIKYTF